MSEQRYIELASENGLIYFGGNSVTLFYKEYVEKGFVFSNENADAVRLSHPKWYAFVESLRMEEKLLMLEAVIGGI